MKRRVLVAVAAALALGHQPFTHTTSAAAAGATSISVHAGGVLAATGAGHYLLQEAFDVQFSFAAIQLGNARAFGSFRHRTEDETGTIDFKGEVTCLAVDSVNRRAWDWRRDNGKSIDEPELQHGSATSGRARHLVSSPRH
jgi:hypothetical protein